MRPLANAILLIIWSAAGAQAAEDAGTCEVERAEAKQLRESLNVCSASARKATERAAQSEAVRDEVRRHAEELSGSLQACQGERERICSGAGALADAVARVGKGAVTPAVQGCVSSGQQAAVSQVLDGYASAASLLSDFVSYLSGATDVPPQPRAPNPTVLRAMVDRLVGSGWGVPPLVLRRILVESIERIAPRFWRRLMAGGRENVERWLGGGGPLDEAALAEIRGGIATRKGRAESPQLEAALRGVEVYRDLAGCDRRGPVARECGRALELQRVLENSGPLLVRQRIQEIWANPCHFDRDAALAWVRELPASSAEIGHSEWREIAAAARAKMFACYLSEVVGSARAPGRVVPPFATWAADRLPGAAGLTSRTLERLDAIRAGSLRDSAEDLCARAAGTLTRLKQRGGVCLLASDDQRPLIEWFGSRGIERGDGASLELQACARAVGLLWLGRQPEIQAAPSHAPAPEELVTKTDLAGGAAELRSSCSARRGNASTFAAGLRSVVRVAVAAGDDVTAPPCTADPHTQLPLEMARLEAASTVTGWARHLLSGETAACVAIGLTPVACRICAGASPEDSYDCQILGALREGWHRRTERVTVTGVLGALILCFLMWMRALRGSARVYGGWHKQVRSSLRAIGLWLDRDWVRWLVPSRAAAVVAQLPEGPEWQRWGARACVLRTVVPDQIRERDVSRAAKLAQRAGASLALLLHDEGASPDLKAVRSLLEWAAKGTNRAVQILPLATERLRGTRTAGELLDVIEQVSVRGNPFDVRGRLVSSSQFFDRERLVSGLIGAAAAGQWVTITGLRRFGKSSLALEVARRLPGPSAYVDLAGFHHEFASSQAPADAAASLLRYVLSQLHQSGRDRYGAGQSFPDPPGPADSMETAQLLAWLRTFVAACWAADGGRTPPAFLLIFDELEQVLGLGSDRIAHSLDVLSILIGRLRASLFESLAPSGSRFGVIFCGAAHPLLWAPLATLAGQSLMGAFQSVAVPRLPDEAAFAMMRGLGARQGIRFTDLALELIVRETVGIPILARRVGSAVLELYDSERANQGALGAVEIGVEGARAAVHREEDPGSPLRVWVEAEIGDPRSPAGAILRSIAGPGRAPARALLDIGRDVVREQLATTGIAALIADDEIDRRSREASAFVVRMLIEIGLLSPEGDPIAPEILTFPDSIVRRTLKSTHQGS